MNIPLDEWSGSKATKEIQKTIERQHRDNTRAQRCMLIFALNAAVAAVIAAWPVVKGWIG